MHFCALQQNSESSELGDQFRLTSGKVVRALGFQSVEAGTTKKVTLKGAGALLCTEQKKFSRSPGAGLKKVVQHRRCYDELKKQCAERQHNLDFLFFAGTR